MPEKQFLGYVHSFRGFAILNIVAIHALAFGIVVPQNFEPDETAILYIVNEVLFHDSTIYFALISGLLFSAILKPRGYLQFFLGKAKFVVAPYVFCTLMFSFILWKEDGTGLVRMASEFGEYAELILPNLLRGEAQFTYWYIPVLLIIFLLTPMLSHLVDSKRPLLHALAWLAMLLPLLFSRPEFSPGVLQITPGAVIYFTGAYTVGLYLGASLDERLDRLELHRGRLLTGALVLSIALFLLHAFQIDRFEWFSLREAVYYAQKLCFAGLVLLWLRSLGEHQPRGMAPVANAAFSIYFLHVVFMLAVAELSYTFIMDPDRLPGSMYLMGMAYFVVAMLGSLLIVSILQRLLGKTSRLLVGS
jgi:surface polysaccharide O-acyltransferase-like enzyme